MKFNSILKKPSFLTIAGYIFIFALVVKAVHVYATRHPSKENLLLVQGVVQQVHLGGHGRSTYFLVQSDNGINEYYSYYGELWPVMEKVVKGDNVSILAERNRLRKGQFITGKVYWIWELTRGDDIVVKYEDVLRMVTNQENHERKYVHWFLLVNTVLLLLAYVRKRLSRASQ